MEQVTQTIPVSALEKFYAAFTGKSLLHGGLTAAYAASLATLVSLINSGVIPTTWVQFKPIVLVGVSGFLGYILKNISNGSSQPTETPLLPQKN